jgi:staphyloferrin B biosynthesis citrate synthase
VPNQDSRPAATFRHRLAGGEQLIGTFIKTPTSHTSEIIGDIGYDFVVIDEEHAPFDRVTIDAALLGARAAGTAGIVRVARPDAANILSALDDGAVGVLVPHVATAAKAREVVMAARYRGGRRGFSNSPRAGRYGGIGLSPHLAQADAQTTVIAMIEDPEALDEIDAIAGVEGIDAFFLGRGDLTVALGAETMDAPEVRNAAERICAAARKASMPLCAMVGGATESGWLSELGVTAFIVASDQAFMRRAASAALQEFKNARSKS